jgi:glycogen synthase
VEYDKDCNFMKAAIDQCDALTTVSPSYAAEILDPWFSYQLDNILSCHTGKLRGILNGIDTDLYNPNRSEPRRPVQRGEAGGQARASAGFRRSWGWTKTGRHADCHGDAPCAAQGP